MLKKINESLKNHTQKEIQEGQFEEVEMSDWLTNIHSSIVNDDELN